MYLTVSKLKTKIRGKDKIKYIFKVFLLLSILVFSVGTKLNNKPTDNLFKEKVYTLISPYDKGYKYQYKINLHAHSTARNEKYAYTPKSLLEMAKKYEFDAYAITDLPDAGGIHEDPGVEGIIYIPGIEYGGNPHVVGVGITSFTKSSDKQEQIDHIKNQGGYAYIPHPYWGKYDEELILKYYNLDGVAVFNSLTYGVAKSENNAYHVIPYNENLIDGLLSKGTSVAIISEEDTKYEDPHIKSIEYGHQLNTAWIKVWGNLPPTAIKVNYVIDLIKEKKFTSHARFLRTSPEPPDFIEISTEELVIKVKVNKNCDLEFISKGGTVKKVFKNITSAYYKVCPKDKYVRIKATYFENESSSWAWTNPIYIN